MFHNPESDQKLNEYSNSTKTTIHNKLTVEFRSNAGFFPSVSPYGFKIQVTKFDRNWHEN
jgi:hypothetical protein